MPILFLVFYSTKKNPIRPKLQIIAVRWFASTMLRYSLDKGHWNIYHGDNNIHWLTIFLELNSILYLKSPSIVNNVKWKRIFYWGLTAVCIESKNAVSYYHASHFYLQKIFFYLHCSKLEIFFQNLKKNCRKYLCLCVLADRKHVEKNSLGQRSFVLHNQMVFTAPEKVWSNS